MLAPWLQQVFCGEYELTGCAEATVADFSPIGDGEVGVAAVEVAHEANRKKLPRVWRRRQHPAMRRVHIVARGVKEPLVNVHAALAAEGHIRGRDIVMRRAHRVVQDYSSSGQGQGSPIGHTATVGLLWGTPARGHVSVGPPLALAIPPTPGV